MNEFIHIFHELEGEKYCHGSGCEASDTHDLTGKDEKGVFEDKYSF